MRMILKENTSDWVTETVARDDSSRSYRQVGLWYDWDWAGLLTLQRLDWRVRNVTEMSQYDCIVQAHNRHGWSLPSTITTYTPQDTLGRNYGSLSLCLRLSPILYLYTIHISILPILLHNFNCRNQAILSSNVNLPNFTLFLDISIKKIVGCWKPTGNADICSVDVHCTLHNWLVPPCLTRWHWSSSLMFSIYITLSLEKWSHYLHCITPSLQPPWHTLTLGWNWYQIVYNIA